MKWLNGYRMRLMLVGFVAAIVLGGGSAKADFIWTQKADMPTPRCFHTSAVVNGKIYVIGGYTSEGPDYRALSIVEEYDPATDTWTRKTDMPTERGDMSPSSAVVDGKIYVIGGDIFDGNYRVIPTVEEYDPATDTWTRKADMPTSRWGSATCTFNGKIYAIGGYPPTNYRGLRTVEEYDPVTDIWTRKAEMPLGVALLNARVVRGKIYAVGGRPDLKSRAYMQEYNPATDTWTQKTDMLVGTSQMGSVVLDDKIIVIGGWLWSMNLPYKAVQIYDTETDIWMREADVPFLRASFSAEVVRGRIFAIGGTDRPHPCPATSTVYEFVPVLDFNTDGIVDAGDMCIMVDHWGEDYSLCDIGPTTFGDGIVDVQDLIALAEHLFEDYRLMAHWKLDEVEGDIAYDCAKTNDAAVLGDPVWQPESGMVDGAIAFDGIDDCIDAPFVLDPADGAFSVFAWIKGGAPGQVIISQADGTGETWLGIDPLEGALMTELEPPETRTPMPPLLSDMVIADNEWHHIGLVWYSTFRALYVDGVGVAEDAVALAPLKSATGGLTIGAGKTLEAASFFSGLIDDVRIYNMALSAEQVAALAQ